MCWRSDYGYSNYTTEGTSLSCLAGLNPALHGHDEPYREVSRELAAALDVAKSCPRYRPGAPAWTDTDTDGFEYGKPITPDVVKAATYTDDEEAAQLLAAHFGWTPDAPSTPQEER